MKNLLILIIIGLVGFGIYKYGIQNNTPKKPAFNSQNAIVLDESMDRFEGIVKKYEDLKIDDSNYVMVLTDFTREVNLFNGEWNDLQAEINQDELAYFTQRFQNLQGRISKIFSRCQAVASQNLRPAF